jgi:hypothetical protein
VEIDITKFLEQRDMSDFSASAAEIGDDAGKLTWQSAMGEEWQPLVGIDAFDEFREFVRSSGGWEESEIMAWTARQLNALCIQWIAGDCREAHIDGESTLSDWGTYYDRAMRGNCNSNLCRNDDGRIYWSAE